SSLFIRILTIADDESRPVLADSTTDHLGALLLRKRRVETMDDRRRYMREDRLLREFTGMCANQDLERLGSVADVAEAQRVGRLRRPVDVMKRTVHVVLAGTSQHELTALDLLQAAVQGTDDVPVGVPENVKLIRTEHCHHTTIMHIKLQLTQANSIVWLWIAQLLASLPNTERTLFRRDHPDLGLVSPYKGQLVDCSLRA